MWDFISIMHFHMTHVTSIRYVFSCPAHWPPKIFYSSRTLNNNGVWNLYGRHVGLTLDIDQVSRRDKNLVIQQMFKS
jgi:hypothetical protein